MKKINQLSTFLFKNFNKGGEVRVSINKNIKISSFKSSEIIQKKEGGPDPVLSSA